MSDTATDLTPPAADTPPPEPEPQAQPQGDGDPTPLNIDDDAAVDAVLEQNAITIPGDDGLVPMSETGKMARAYREKIKSLKTELTTATTSAAEAAALKEQIQQLQAQLQQTQPYVSAYQAMQQAAQQAAPTPEEDAEAEEYARLLDLYTPEGKPDIARGKKGLAIQRKLAESAAQQHVAPLQAQTLGQQSAYNLARAKNTALPNGAKADPQILEHVWRQLDPALTATPEGARQALIAAIGYTVATGAAPPSAPQQTAQRGPNGQFTGQPLPAPIVTEKAGGKEGANHLPLSQQELKYIKDSGMSEKDYLAATPPWMRK